MKSVGKVEPCSNMFINKFILNTRMHTTQEQRTRGFQIEVNSVKITSTNALDIGEGECPG